MGERDRSFIVYGREIVFSEKQMRYNTLFNTYRNKAFAVADDYMNDYFSYGNWETFSRKGIVEGYRIIDNELSEMHKKLVSEGCYALSLDGIKNIYYASHTDWMDLDDEVSEINRRVGEFIDETKELREFRKESRGRVVGGGFGIDGALKGMAFAGAANATTGLAHSVANAIGNARTEREVKKALDERYNDPEFQDSVYSALLKMVWGIFEIYYSSHKDDYESLLVDGPSTATVPYLVENLSSIPKEHVEEVIVEVLQKSPYYYGVYSWILNEYGITKDVDDFAKAFGMDFKLNKERREILNEYAETLLKNSKSADWDPEKAIRSCYDKRKYLNYYGGLTENEAKIQEMETETRRVNGIVYNTAEEAEKVRDYRKEASAFIEKMDSLSFEEVEAKRSELKRLNKDCKGGLDDYLKTIDEKYVIIERQRRTYHNKVYESVQDKQRAQSNYEYLMKGVHDNKVDKQGYLALKQRINERDYESWMKEEASSIIRSYEVDQYIFSKYGELDLSCEAYDAEKLSQWKYIVDEVTIEYGKDVESVQLSRIRYAIYDMQSIKTNAEKKKANVVGVLSVSAIKGLVYIVLGFIGIIAVLLIFHGLIIRAFLIIGIVMVVKEKVSDLLSEIEYQTDQNKMIDEARKKMTTSSFGKNVPRQEREKSGFTHVEPNNNSNSVTLLTQNIKSQSDQNKEQIKAERTITDYQNSNAYDSNTDLEQQRFCYNCGKPITGDSIFCSYCGVKLK